MAQQFSRKFYDSPLWRRTRKAYIKRVHGLCEECLKHDEVTPGKILHHIDELNASNINEADVTINFDNLIYLCDYHHKKVHGMIGETIREGFRFDEHGNIVKNTPPGSEFDKGKRK